MSTSRCASSRAGPARSRPEAAATPSPRASIAVGDRLEGAVEHHADPLAAAREEPERPHRLRRTLIWLAITGVSLYLVAPSVIETLGSWRQIQRLSVAALLAMAALETAALACLWVLQRLAIHRARWQPIIASQLAGNALAKVAPGGGAMGAALQARMLADTGLAMPAVVTGLTVANLVVFAVVLGLPVLSLPSIIRGGVQHDLLNAAAVAVAVFALLFVVCTVLVSSDRPLAWLGRVLQRIRNRLRPRAAPLTALPDRLVRERRRILDTLGPRWHFALATGLGRWLLDFGALLAALAALHVLPRPGLALLAFCAAQLLAQIPVTPGGLGFVEAGLTATLTLAGVPAGSAVVVTFAYRLFAYWLQIPLGLVGLALQRAPVATARRDRAAG